jgi:hypothetical protein
MVAHFCNPSFSGGKDQEYHCSPWAKSERDPISTNNSGLVVCFYNPS